MILDGSRVPNVITRDLIKERGKRENERRCKGGSRGQKVKIAALQREEGWKTNESF